MFGIHPGIIFAIAMTYATVVFLSVWCFLNYSHNRTSTRFRFFTRFLEKARKKGDSPVIRKYGLVGLTMIMAVPFPTIGVYGATSLSWMMGASRWRALTAIISGVAISNSLMLLSALGIIHMASALG